MRQLSLTNTCFFFLVLHPVGTADSFGAAVGEARNGGGRRAGLPGGVTDLEDAVRHVPAAAIRLDGRDAEMVPIRQVQNPDGRGRHRVPGQRAPTCDTGWHRQGQPVRRYSLATHPRLEDHAVAIQLRGKKNSDLRNCYPLENTIFQMM